MAWKNDQVSVEETKKILEVARDSLEVEGDFVELPSQIMENWAFEPELLSEYAMHYRSGDVISKSLIDKLRRSSHFNQGFMTTELIAASLSDLDIHTLTTVEEDFDAMAFEQRVLTEKRGLIEQIAPRYRYTYFSHIFDGGYESGYYSYKWAEVLAADAFTRFEKEGPTNAATGADFRRAVLSTGGSLPEAEAFRNFMGRDPNPDALLQQQGM